MTAAYPKIDKEEKPSAQNFETEAQRIFKDRKILVERPEGMTYDEYWFLRKGQSLLLNRMFRHCPERKLIGIISGREIYKTRLRK